jgi:hypothetical protein
LGIGRDGVIAFAPLPRSSAKHRCRSLILFA